MPQSPVAPGEILADRYRVDRILGEGGMGVVVAATHVQLGQRVAVKFLRPGASIPAEQLERFLREGRAAARLRSQHVTRVLDVGSLADGSPYTVMELLDGQDLASVLESRGPLPIPEAVGYVLQACEALAEAHAAGIVHRDVKPANLFLATDASGAPCVKLFDFGISKLSGDLALTGSVAAMGTPLYIPPEQINSARDADARADLWSLAVTFYELVTRKTPFESPKIERLMWRILSDAPTPLRSLQPEVPPELEAVVFRCLEKDPERRFPDVAALAAALAPWAPPHAAPYVDRVARILGASGSASVSSLQGAAAPAASPASAPAPSAASAPTSTLASSPTLAADASSPGGSPLASTGGSTRLSLAATAPQLATLPGSTGARRRLHLLALAIVSLAVLVPGALWVALHDRGAPPPATAPAAALSAAPSASAPLPVDAPPTVTPQPSAALPPSPPASTPPVASPAPPARTARPRTPPPSPSKQPSIW